MDTQTESLFMTHGYVLTAGQVMKLIMIDISIVRTAVRRLNGVRNNMNVLEEILEEIRDNAKLGNMRWESIRIEKVEEIIRSYMSEKEKVSSAEIISWNIDGKPYYGIKFKKVGEDDYTVGYGSYKLDYVINWLNECFEFYSEVKVSVNVAKDTNVPSKQAQDLRDRESFFTE